MNNVTLMGRLTKDPDIRYSQGDSALCIARYTLAVNRRKKDDPTDFISCVAFGKSGEFAEKFLHKGMRVCIRGRIQTGSYVNKDGQKVYTTDVIVEEHEFAESKQENMEAGTRQEPDLDGFMSLPDEIDDELPFA